MLHVFIYVWFHDLNNTLWSFLPPLCPSGFPWDLPICLPHNILTMSFLLVILFFLHIKCYLLSLLLLHKSAIPSHLSLLLLGCSPTHMTTPASSLCILYCWVIEPSQDHEPPLPLIADKVILGYICSWSHESLHMSSLFGGLVPGSSGDSGLINI